jgi:RecB family endonuclease NucS
MSIETISVKNARELEQILVSDISAIEKGLTIIGSQIPINTSTKLDVLCHDEDGALVIFQLSTQEDDAMLFEALKALSYLDTVKHMMKFYYSNFKINDAETPRLILLAPSFSKNLLTIASHLTGLRIDLYEWEYLKFGDQKGLRIEPISLSPLTSKARERRGAKEQHAEKPSSTAPETPVTEEAPEKKEDKEQTKKKSLLRL